MHSLHRSSRLSTPVFMPFMFIVSCCINASKQTLVKMCVKDCQTFYKFHNKTLCWQIPSSYIKFSSAVFYFESPCTTYGVEL